MALVSVELAARVCPNCTAPTTTGVRVVLCGAPVEPGSGRVAVTEAAYLECLGCHGTYRGRLVGAHRREGRYVGGEFVAETSVPARELIGTTIE